jgi:Raf kinase inhibitor-like YbhB/YbcL family protein
MNSLHLAVIVIFITGIFVCGCSALSPSASSQRNADANQSFSLQVASLVNGSTLPGLNTCSGFGQSPKITWKNVPDKTKSLVLIMDDPDAPSGLFTHWIVYNLDPASDGIPVNQVSNAEKAGTGSQGLNSVGVLGYYPPCPPGSEVHRYMFTLSALDSRINPLKPEPSAVDSAMAGHILGTSQVTTTFGR